MKVRKIIISDHDKKSGTLGIKIDKEKLVKYIVRSRDASDRNK